MGKPHAQRKSEIIHYALELASEVGVKKVTTQAIADRVGIAQATVFRHFKSRDAIFSAAIEWLAQQMFAVLSACFQEKSLPADQRLNMLIEQQLGFISRNKGLPRLLFSDRLHIESPVLKAAVQSIMTRYTLQLSELVDDGRTEGVFRQDIDSAEVARMVAALIQGSVMRWSIFDFEFDLVAEAEPLKRFLDTALREVQA